MRLALAVLALAVLAACSGARPPHFDPSADWPSYNRDLRGNRFSPLMQITAANAAALHRVCRIPLAEIGALQAGPLEIDGTLYVTTAHQTYAIDATTCALRWSSAYKSAGAEPNPVNRGLAWDGGGRLIRGEPDGHLIALNLSDGKVLWNVAPASGARSEFLSSAPIVWNDTAYIGVAGGSWGAKGRMMAFDVRNGALRWSFATLAKGNAPPAGGGLWTSYTLDTNASELFISVGNPAPDFAPATRPGANLYTDSLVALDASTGKLRWYFQADPNDGHDWDLASPADLVTVGARRIAAIAGKDGFVYGIDRVTHLLLWRTSEVRRENARALATAAGTHICPGTLGGAEWNGAAYDALHHLLVTPMDDWCGIYKLGLLTDRPGGLFQGGTFVRDPYDQARGALTATDALSGRIVWRYRSATPMVAGVTPTAGGIVVTGDLAGNVLVFESASGRVLFREHTEGGIAGGVITYSVGGRQYIAATSGNISRFTWGPHGIPSIVVYSL